MYFVKRKDIIHGRTYFVIRHTKDGLKVYKTKGLVIDIGKYFDINGVPCGMQEEYCFNTEQEANRIINNLYSKINILSKEDLIDGDSYYIVVSKYGRRNKKKVILYDILNAKWDKDLECFTLERKGYRRQEGFFLKTKEEAELVVKFWQNEDLLEAKEELELINYCG